jgi:plasmid stabilization system protein ParE
MKILILCLARNDLYEINNDLLELGDIHLQKFRESFEKFCSLVVDMPYMHNVYEYNNKYRKAAIIYGYLIFYQGDEKTSIIKIFRILHGKRNIDSIMG